ncbi:glycerophosphoryl diester phosphodiesterase [Paenibacillus montaniterrae]|uniref:Glycerophosphoryl diester phosphodiesterase n=1 Tax=Paenibacillus montaniterrae TaxID=429341 RepID=A0A920CU36_9BACL|nr:glycerophosphodiester phosphodiesterase family protein [Paenibacillus montaniterrae]GIP16582.1 glycerophosphoryl diester phosphodiesterase [Paenibacillus montaniterrae]
MTIRGLAHRGYPLKHPENTLLGFRAAIELGFTHLELDVHLTKDGVPVVIHDPTVNRTTNGTGAVKDYTLDELLKLDAGQGEFVPTLEEVLLLAKDRILVDIELKQTGNAIPGLEAAVIEVVKRVEMLDQVVITSFDHYSIARVRELDAQIELGLVIYGATPAIFPYMKQLGAKYVSLKHLFLTAEFAAEARQHDVQLIAWTPDHEDELRFLRANYPDVLICTNNLEGLGEGR